MTSLRSYQLTTISRAREAFRSGARRLVLVSPVGSGKTRIASEIVGLSLTRSRRPLWVVRGRDLVDQAAKALRANGHSVGVTMAGYTHSYGAVHVASIDTLLARSLRPEADLIIVDECHGAVTDEYAAFIRDYPNARVIGLTATPSRADGRGLGELFDRLIVVAEPRELVEAGYLVRCDVHAPAEELKPRQLAQTPIDAYRQYADGTSAIVYAGTVAKAHEFAEQFPSAAVIHAKTPTDERQRHLDDFAAGRILVLCNVGTLVEGTDLPRAATMILARKVTAIELWVQIIGRGRRLFTGKDRCLVLDLYGSVYLHGHPDEPRVYSLEGRGISRAPAAADTFCRVCGCPIEPGANCPDCGTGPRKPKPLTIREQKLIKFEKAMKRAEGKPLDPRTKQLAAWIADGAARGRKLNSAMFKFKGVFGRFPRATQVALAKREAGI